MRIRWHRERERERERERPDPERETLSEPLRRVATGMV